MKKIISLIMAICIVFTFAACDKKSDGKKITLVLDWTPNTNHTGFYAARDLGYYEQAGLEVDIIQPPEDGAYALVASGRAQFCVGFQETMAAALTADAPLGITAVAAIVEHNTSGIISSKEKNITSFKDMEGFNYATWDSPLERHMIKAVMEKQGGDIENVEFIPTTVTDVMSALKGNIDTVWVYEGWDVAAAKVSGFEYNFIKFSDVLPVLDFYTPVLVAGNTFLENDPETARKFVEATAKGYEYAIDNPEASAEILVKAVPELDKELIIESQLFLAGEYKAEKPKWGLIDKQRWTAFYDWAYDKGLISKPLGSQGFTNKFLTEGQ